MLALCWVSTLTALANPAASANITAKVMPGPYAPPVRTIVHGSPERSLWPESPERSLWPESTARRCSPLRAPPRSQHAISQSSLRDRAGQAATPSAVGLEATNHAARARSRTPQRGLAAFLASLGGLVPAAAVPGAGVAAGAGVILAATT